MISRPRHLPLLLFVFGSSCGGARHEGKTQILPPTDVAKPDAATESQGPAPVTGDPWLREAVDYETYDRRGAIGIANGTPAILAHARNAPATSLLTRGAASWSASQLDGTTASDHMTFDRSGSPWLVRGRGFEVYVRTPAGTVDHVMPGEVQGDRGDVAIAFDRSGAPHLCVASNVLTPDGRHVWAGVRYATRQRAGWHVEKVTDGRAHACAIAVEADGTVDIAVTEPRETSVWVRRTGAWTREVLSDKVPTPAESRFITGTTSAGGVAFAFAHESSIEVARRDGTGWRGELFDTGGIVPEMLALALDGKGRVHVALSGRSPEYKVAYVRSGASPTIVGDRNTGGMIALALDANQDPHLAFVTDTGDPQHAVRTLVHARQRRRGEAEVPVVRHDATAMIYGCAEQITIQLQSTSDRFDASGRRVGPRSGRLCRALAAISPTTLDEIVRRCTGGDAKACLVAATIAAKDAEKQVFVTFDLRPATCDKPSAGAHCSWKFHRSTAFRFGITKAGEADSDRLYEAACSGGIVEACFQRAAVQHRAGRLTSPSGFVRACSPRFPMACAAAVATVDPATADASQLTTVRGALATACASSGSCLTGSEAACPSDDLPEACNALAYLEEAGLGGPAAPRDAAAHHHLACERGSASSCARLLVGPFARPAAPKRLEASTFEWAMTTRCEARGEDECLALATAHELGWVVPRNPKAATAVLGVACDAGHAKACARLGIKPPARSP